MWELLWKRRERKEQSKHCVESVAYRLIYFKGFIIAGDDAIEMTPLVTNLISASFRNLPPLTQLHAEAHICIHESFWVAEIRPSPKPHPSPDILDPPLCKVMFDVRQRLLAYNA